MRCRCGEFFKREREKQDFLDELIFKRQRFSDIMTMATERVSGELSKEVGGGGREGGEREQRGTERCLFRSVRMV